MMRIGRVADADRAWLTIAHDPAVPPAVFFEAIQALLATTDVAGARGALTPETPDSLHLSRLVGGSSAKQARVGAVTARLAALGAQ